jgi:hypothetical protein
MIRQETEPKLSYDGSSGSTDFEGSIRRSGKGTGGGEIDITDHDVGEVHSEDIVCISVTGEDVSKQTMKQETHNPTPATTIALFQLATEKCKTYRT